MRRLKLTLSNIIHVYYNSNIHIIHFKESKKKLNSQRCCNTYNRKIEIALSNILSIFVATNCTLAVRLISIYDIQLQL